MKLHLAGSAPPPPYLRCRRNDGRQWRCSRSALPNARFCEHHHRLLQLNQAKHHAATTTIAVAADLKPAKPPPDRTARELRRRRGTAPVAAPPPHRRQRKAVPATAAPRDRRQREAVPETAAPLDRRQRKPAPAAAPPPDRRQREVVPETAAPLDRRRREPAPAAAPPPDRRRSEAAPATVPGHEGEAERHTEKESRGMEVNAVEALVVTGYLPNGVMTISPRGFDNAEPVADEEVEIGGRLIQRQFRSKHAELVQVARRQKGLPYRICSPIAWKRACS